MTRNINEQWEVSQEASVQIIDNTPEASNKFWAKHNDLMDLYDNANIASYWNFQRALGNTISEKVESLYLKLREILDFQLKSGAEGYFWIATNGPALACISSIHGFKPTLPEESYKGIFKGQYFLKSKDVNDIRDAGTLLKQWKIFEWPGCPQEGILFGVGNSRKEDQLYGRMTIGELYC